MKFILQKSFLVLFIITAVSCNYLKKVNNHMDDKDAQKYLDAVLNKVAFNHKPENGVIPDEQTAIKIGEIILSNIYGSSKIESERPFNANLVNGYWIVYGSLPFFSLGGVAEIVLKKDTGEVINISHGK